ncbi:aminotransferase class I/II-fold pyridoxal phosphate-dependent enzyme [Salinisphaera sp. G21_0]|uniref:aminotransferase class I/II-fold pyridoxal phosphate-dependent enzyme n=1 Tax=Salinisphaera sp. G21_0 TaxID=2821094 RepID=UPI001ADC29B6|nr:aminotransferase class I/II-fold pyridoxal phosphate-dependent enzyme [Salinisphaera sp. G21_0]MBO9480688.1 aminotransferase class I/II-fold pyridoxal phosphate-dependent enzyme [Salinisphaera sp. G21_0]
MNLEDEIIEINQSENRRAHIYAMLGKMKQYDLTAVKIEGRRIWVDEDHSVIDFASCNYLGLDLDEEMQNDIRGEIVKWGVHPSWCRLVASPAIYQQIENQLATLIGVESTLIFPTVTLISIGVLLALVGRGGVLILDKSGHETMYEAAKIARDSGATLLSFPQNDLETLELHLQKHQNNKRKVIMIDGVYSMSGDFARVPAIVALAKKYDAIVYIDDAHGFGVVGENPTSAMPYGQRGNGIVRYYGLDYENIIYVGGCSKAYSSLAAFVGCSKKMQSFIKGFSTPYDLSGPCPTASLATLAKGLVINEHRGNQYREKLFALTHKCINGLRSMGFEVINQSWFPIIFVRIGDNQDTIETANLLFEKGILVTVSPYPMVVIGQEGHRITLTAANTPEEVEELLACFQNIRDYLINKHSNNAIYET